MVMASPKLILTALALTSLHIAPSLGQTFTKCNPLENSCPADPALGRSVSVDFTSGPSDEFKPDGNPTYDSNGVSFAVTGPGVAPQLMSNWYIMFGKIEVSLKAAPGAGIVSSFVLQSDDLDEIDWEWLGADPDNVQTNYFGKGITGTYNRGGTSPDPGSQSGFKTYSIDWTSDSITWSIDGTVVRTQTASDAVASGNQYPQSPMQIKFGSWSAGDPSNAEGTIEWSKGPTDFSQQPFIMQVSAITVTDYSTGSQYTYGDNSGSWESIQSDGGSINGNGDGAASAPPPPSITQTPGTDATVPGVSGTATSYPGLPPGWTISSDGKVHPPPSTASIKHQKHTSPTPSSPPSSEHGSQGFETSTTSGSVPPAVTGDSRAGGSSGGSQSPPPSAAAGLFPSINAIMMLCTVAILSLLAI